MVPATLSRDYAGKSAFSSGLDYVNGEYIPPMASTQRRSDARRARGGKRERRFRMGNVGDLQSKAAAEALKIYEGRLKRHNVARGRDVELKASVLKKKLQSNRPSYEQFGRDLELSKKKVGMRLLSKSKVRHVDRELAENASSLHAPKSEIDKALDLISGRVDKKNREFGTHALTVSGAYGVHRRMEYRDMYRGMIKTQKNPALAKIHDEQPGEWKKVVWSVRTLLRTLVGIIFSPDNYEPRKWQTNGLDFKKLDEMADYESQKHVYYRVLNKASADLMADDERTDPLRASRSYNYYRNRHEHTEFLVRFMMNMKIDKNLRKTVDDMRHLALGDRYTQLLKDYYDYLREMLPVMTKDGRAKRKSTGNANEKRRISALRLLLIMHGIEPNPGPPKTDFSGCTMKDFVPLDENLRKGMTAEQQVDHLPPHPADMDVPDGEDIPTGNVEHDLEVAEMEAVEHDLKQASSVAVPVDKPDVKEENPPPPAAVAAADDLSPREHAKIEHEVEELKKKAAPQIANVPALKPYVDAVKKMEGMPIGGPDLVKQALDRGRAKFEEKMKQKALPLKTAFSSPAAKDAEKTLTKAQRIASEKQDKERLDKKRQASAAAHKSSDLVKSSLARTAAEQRGESDALRERIKDLGVEINEKEGKLGEALEEIKKYQKQTEEARKNGFLPQDGEPEHVLCFHGKFRHGMNSTFNYWGVEDKEGKTIAKADPVVTVYIYADGTWESDAIGQLYRVKITADMLNVASSSVACTDGNKRCHNIYNGLMACKEIKDYVKSLTSADKVEYMYTIELVAFLLTGVINACGHIRWMNECEEWVVDKYTVLPPPNWKEMLEGVYFASDTLKFQASVARGSRAAPFVVADLIPHIPDSADLGTLISGLCKRLFPDLPVRSQSTLRRISIYTDDLIQCIQQNTQNYVPPLFNQLLKEALKGRPRREVDGIMRGVEMCYEDEKAAIEYYKSCTYKCFIKAESYPDGTYKPPRFIQSLPLEARGIQIFFMAPILKLIEEGTRICNVKGRQPDLITSLLRNKFEARGIAKVAETDFSSFESGIGPDLKHILENRIFRALARTPEQIQFIDECLDRRTVSVVGPCFSIPQFHHIRMSGDYWTSLGNLVSNIVLISYCTQTPVAQIMNDGLFEGDDGVFPAPQDPEAVKRRAVKAGVKLTFDIAPWQSLSFCGNHFEEFDGDLLRHRDKYKALANCTILFNPPRGDKSNDRMLQRSKCLAYLSGPIIPDCFVFCAVVERVTRSNPVDQQKLERMGLLKPYSSYGVEGCVPEWLYMDVAGNPLTDVDFCKEVFKRNRAAGGDCTYDCVVRMLATAMAAGPGTQHCVLESPMPVDNPGTWYARDGSRFTHKDRMLGCLPILEYNDVQNYHFPNRFSKHEHYTRTVWKMPFFQNQMREACRDNRFHDTAKFNWWDKLVWLLVLFSPFWTSYLLYNYYSPSVALARNCVDATYDATIGRYQRYTAWRTREWIFTHTSSTQYSDFSLPGDYDRVIHPQNTPEFWNSRAKLKEVKLAKPLRPREIFEARRKVFWDLYEREAWHENIVLHSLRWCYGVITHAAQYPDVLLDEFKYDLLARFRSDPKLDQQDWNDVDFWINSLLQYIDPQADFETPFWLAKSIAIASRLGCLIDLSCYAALGILVAWCSRRLMARLIIVAFRLVWWLIRFAVYMMANIYAAVVRPPLQLMVWILPHVPLRPLLAVLLFGGLAVGWHVGFHLVLNLLF